MNNAELIRRIQSNPKLVAVLIEQFEKVDNAANRTFLVRIDFSNVLGKRGESAYNKMINAYNELVG